MRLILPTVLALLPLFGFGQQLSSGTPFQNYRFIWNPAMTAPNEHWETGLSFRQEWLGFEGAPQTATIHGQYPFLRENMSLGGFFMYDDVGPIRFSTLAVTYAYKFEPRFIRGDQLSIGVMAMMNQFFVDGLDVKVKDEDDALLLVNESSQFKPNAGIGIYYTTYARDTYRKTYYYAGIAANQLLPSDVTFENVGSEGNLKRVIHANALVGARFINDEFFVEPSLWFNYSAPNLVNAMLSVRIEQYKAFWAGLSFSTDQTMGIQVGYIVPDLWIRDGDLRIGALGSYNIGDFGRARGMGFEIYCGYWYEL